MSENKDKSNEYNNAGQIEIAEEVIAVIAVTAALEVEGVATTVSKSFVEFFGKKTQTKCIKIEKDENSISVNLDVIVQFGTKVLEVAEKVQNKVKNALETMTGMTVDSVNIAITGIVKEKSFNTSTKEEI